MKPKASTQRALWARAETDAVQSDDVLELLTTELRTLSAYLHLAGRQDLPEVVQVRVAGKVGGSMLAYDSAEGAPGLQAARTLYQNPTYTPTAIGVAASELSHCTESGKHTIEVVELLLAHPSCTPAARVRAAWSLTVENGFYLQQKRSGTEAALKRLGEGCPLAALAGTLGKYLRDRSGDTSLGRRHPAAAFAAAVEAVHAEMGGSQAAAETFCALLPEWEGDLQELARAVQGILATGTGRASGTVAA